MTYYTYIYNDLSKDEPFYVGKGHGNRAHIHLRRVKDNPHFSNRLAKMKREDNLPEIEIINTTNECAAFWLERCFIAAFGRRDLKTGPLLNMTNGGENPPSFKGKHHSKEAKERIRIGMLGNKRCVGITHTEATKKIIGEKNRINRTGKKDSDKGIEHKRLAGIKRHERDGTRRIINTNKPVYGSKWYNNGVVNTLIMSNGIIPEGYVKGRLLKRNTTTGRVV